MRDTTAIGGWPIIGTICLLLVKCATIKKSSQFPLQDESQRAYVESDCLDEETHLLINPLQEDPEDFIEYDFENPIMVKAVGKCETKQKKTVDNLTGINSKGAMRARLEKLENLKDAILLFEIQGDRKKIGAAYFTGKLTRRIFKVLFKKQGNNGLKRKLDLST